MFKKKVVQRVSYQLPRDEIAIKDLRKNISEHTNGFISTSQKELNSSQQRKFIYSPKMKQNSLSKIIHSKSPSQNINKSRQINISPTNCLSLIIEINVHKQIKTLQFKYSSNTQIKALLSFLKQQLKQQAIVFKGPSLMIDYLLSLEDQYVLALKAKRLTLKALQIKHNQFVNNPLTNFRVLKCIGAGGFSKVFLVQIFGIYSALKVIPKKLLLDNDKQIIVLNQKNILIQMNRHPFITRVHYTFQTAHNICIALEYCSGGELFYLLKKIKRMKQHQAQFYFLQVLSALKALHQKGIVYRDLKPQNIIIDHDGHIRLADFGLSKKLQQQTTYSFCGSAEYMAPQMLLKQGHDFSIDYYCIGALLYELVTGLPPYYCKDQQQLFTNILTSNLNFPDHKVTLSPSIKSLLKGLLNKNPKKRLGSTMGIMQIFAHPWITNLNIPKLINKQLQPPFKPDLLVYNFDDTEYEDKERNLIKQLQQQAKTKNITNLMFEDFYFQSKDMKIALENLKNVQKRQNSVNKQRQRTYKTPENKFYLKQNYESILSPKQYAFVKTKPIIKQQFYKNPEYQTQNIRHSSNNQIRRLVSDNDSQYRKSVQKLRTGSLERKKISQNIFNRYSQQKDRRYDSRDYSNNSLKYHNAYSYNTHSTKVSSLSSNVQSPRRPQVDIGRIKSSQVLKRGFLQKDKLKGYFNR